MTREEFYKLTDILNSEVLGSFMHGSEADELIAMFEESVEHSNILEQEEPVSKDLEEASKEWLKPQLDKSYANYGEAKMMELTHFDSYAMLDAIEFGAKWQKEQMMAKAIDAHCFGFQGDALFTFRLPAGSYLIGSKVKVIVIKED